MYRFKLEALLNHRRHQEEVCQKALAASERQLSAAQVKLRRQKIEKRENIGKLQANQKTTVNISHAILSLNYIQKLSQEIENQKICVREAAQRVNQMRNELIVSVKKRKTLERLKEKGRLAYREKLMHDERKLMDEAASIRHVHKNQRPPAGEMRKAAGRGLEPSSDGGR